MKPKNNNLGLKGLIFLIGMSLMGSPLFSGNNFYEEISSKVALLADYAREKGNKQSSGFYHCRLSDKVEYIASSPNYSEFVIQVEYRPKKFVCFKDRGVSGISAGDEVEFLDYSAPNSLISRYTFNQGSVYYDPDISDDEIGKTFKGKELNDKINELNDLYLKICNKQINNLKIKKF